MVPDEKVCAVLDQDDHVFKMSVLGGDVQGSAAFPTNAAGRVHVGSGLQQDSQTSELYLLVVNVFEKQHLIFILLTAYSFGYVLL